MRDKFVRCECHSRLRHNAGHHQFAPLGIRYSEDCGFANCRMLVNDGFDLTGVDILASGDNHVFQAVQDIEIPFGILIADVAGAKLAISKCKRSLVGIIPVSPHDVGAARHQFAWLSSFDLLP